MPTFYLDETGFTGEDLMTEEQPYFVQATNDLSTEETQDIIGNIFSGVRADELKHRSLSRRAAGQERVVEFVRWAARNPKRFAIWVVHKEYAMATFIVEWWIEPLAHKTGLNLYKDGANHALANMLFICLQGFWDTKFRRKVLLAFQSMFRSRTKERYYECEKLIAKMQTIAMFDEARSDIIRYLSNPFAMLGYKHLIAVPDRALDLALPGLVRLGHHWRELHEGPWEVVHDRSSNMAKQKWMWDKLSGTDISPAEFDGPKGVAIFPMNVVTTRFANSIVEKQIQLCDLLAGATAASIGPLENDDYRSALSGAGIDKLTIDAIWPTKAVTPEELGRKGWDGNEALNYLSKVLELKDAAEEPKPKVS